MSRFRTVTWLALLTLSLVRCTVPSLEDLWRERGFCARGDDACGMLRVRVEAKGFEPGCLRFVVEDAASKAALSLSVPATPGGAAIVTQGFSPPKSWGLEVAVSVVAFDRTCEDSPVVSQSERVTLKEGKTVEVPFVVSATDSDQDGYPSVQSGGTDCDDQRADVNPGAAERCNAKDDNCDQAIDEGFGVGEACTSAEGCGGVRACQQDGLAVCQVSAAQYGWADEDGDGHGDVSRGAQTVCADTLPPNRLPTTAPHDDCDDLNAGVYPSATERCNGMDDNCNGERDEGFFVGATCVENGSGCYGLRACDAPGTGSICQLPSTFPTWYPDDDSDTYGQNDAGVVACAPPDAGFVARSADCDDGNPFIHAEARERCDQQDNDCDGTVDEGVCLAGQPRFIAQSVGDAGTQWLGVSQYRDGGVWVVGTASSRAVMVPGSDTFATVPGDCSTTGSVGLLSVWAHPQTGVAYLISNNAQVIRQNAQSTTCHPRVSLVGGAYYANDIHGFPMGTNAELHGVTAETNAPDASVGGTFLWDGGTPPWIAAPEIGGGPLRGVHGESPDTMFAVGGRDAGTIFRYSPASKAWNSDPTVPASKPLNGVRVVNSRLAYAVGVEGEFLVWDGVRWSRRSLPTSENLTDVLAFGKNSVYVLSDRAKMYRYNGLGWTTSNFVGLIYDIEGSSPDDIWLAGGVGLIYHYPMWPE
ncbi:putative metal-binding motif-containing protein [Corallococcus llansteffanensis]|uniref:Uncharacterized protein n=1 Tax=Corallococcus llansteffanensis TaxID=2316731 RepID=A0A3A8PNW9_9BACT|nr:putative metal-binding motif-containing protein [Corallococcus llansteffanensis]RKH57888.1 hypothetical protein D7V93_17745 [Corallococcus llansteffanensis]